MSHVAAVELQVISADAHAVDLDDYPAWSGDRFGHIDHGA